MGRPGDARAASCGWPTWPGGDAPLTGWRGQWHEFTVYDIVQPTPPDLKAMEESIRAGLAVLTGAGTSCCPPLVSLR